MPVSNTHNNRTIPRFQLAAIVVCVLLSTAMVINTQMGGEGMWFWYTMAFHNGAKLYSQLHTPLQPLNVLIIDAWMHVSGVKLIPWELLSYLPIAGLCASFYLLLRESDWPEWQKGCILVGAYALTVSGHTYRFDDYHVYAETYMFVALVSLLWMHRARTAKACYLAALMLGVCCATTWTTRVNDGAALLAASFIMLPFLLRKRLFASYAILLVTFAGALLLIVALTGDSFHSYIMSTLFHAGSSKGGTGSVFAAPLELPLNALKILWMEKTPPVILLFVLALGPIFCHYWGKARRFLFAIDLAAVVLSFCLVGHKLKSEMLHGSFLASAELLLPFLMDVLPLVVFYRFVRAKAKGKAWDAREILVVLPVAGWASNAASSAGEPLMNVYAPIAMFLVLVAILIPAKKGPAWWRPQFSAFLILLAVASIVGKALVPYSWQNYVYSPMFVNRQMYHHPVYGWIYIDKDLLQFSERVCADIGSVPGQNQPELLSLPYPYPNYFCATPPWKNYVQTFFDTTSHEVIEHLTSQLDTAPPQYIVYQRQLNILNGAERLFNHGQRLPQRDLDSMIFRKIDSGEWKLLDRSNYLNEKGYYGKDDAAWYIIQTRP